MDRVVLTPPTAADHTTPTQAKGSAMGNLQSAVSLLKKLSTDDPNFSPALKHIQLLLKGPGGAIDDGLADITINREAKGLIFRAPTKAFTGALRDTHVESLLRELLKFAASEITVSHDGLVAHLMPIIREVIATSLLGEPVTISSDGRPKQVELASRTSGSTSDTAILTGIGADDTAVEGMRRTKTVPQPVSSSAEAGSSEEIDRQSGKDKELLVKLGVKNADGTSGDYRSIAQDISNSFAQAKNTFKNAWEKYSSRLRSDLGTPKATETLEKLINIFSWCNSLRKEKALAFSEVLDELTASLKQFIFKAYERDPSGRDNAQAQIISAIGKISPENLLTEVQGQYSETAFIDKVKDIRFADTVKSTRTSSASMAILEGSFDDGLPKKGLTDGRNGTGLVRTTGASSGSGSLARNEEVEVFPINADFTDYLFTGKDGYKSINVMVDQIAKAIQKANSQTADPFAGNIPPTLIEELDKAASREAIKKSEPSSPAVSPFLKINEMSQYLQYLSNTLNLNDDLMKHCAGKAPSAYALPFILMNYYKQGGDRRTVYNAVLDELGKRHPAFRGMSNTIANLERAIEEEARKEQELAMGKLVQGINSKRSESRTTLAEAIRNHSPERDTLLRTMGMVCEPQFSQANTEGLLIRLSEAGLNDPERGLLLNQDRDFTNETLFYLLTGNIPITPITDLSPQVFNLTTGIIESLTKDDLCTRYAAARKSIISDLLPDNVRSGKSILSIAARIKGKASMSSNEPDHAQNIAASCLELLSKTENILKTGAGWARNEFTSRLNAINEQVKSSGFIPLLRDFILTPNSSRAFGIRIAEQNDGHSALVALLGKIWRAISSTAKTGDTGQIDAGLKQLSA